MRRRWQIVLFDCHGQLMSGVVRTAETRRSAQGLRRLVEDKIGARSGEFLAELLRVLRKDEVIEIEIQQANLVSNDMVSELYNVLRTKVHLGSLIAGIIDT
jgi:primosomal protein N''